MSKGIIKRTRQFYSTRRINTWVIFYVLIYAILIIKLITIQELDSSMVFGVYSFLASLYILSRFALVYFYEPDPTRLDRRFEPTISFGIPAKNEEANIKETILRIAATDYPKDKFDIIAINDGSTDGTLDEMMAAQRTALTRGIHVRIIHWQRNKGKREGMAECVRQSTKDIVIFIDSDSFVEPSTARALVQYFADDRVAAVAGHAYVANANTNLLTKMQEVRYFVAFKAYKAAEALFGAVTCCSGCCSAYRRAYLGEMLDPWLHQRFLGVPCTYGDDRSLTNFLLQRGYKALFAPEAIAYTFVPDGFRQFMRQQLRWKKSRVRESFKAPGFMWQKHPLMALSFYLGVLLPLVAPVVLPSHLVPVTQPLTSRFTA